MGINKIGVNLLSFNACPHPLATSLITKATRKEGFNDNTAVNMMKMIIKLQKLHQWHFVFDIIKICN